MTGPHPRLPVRGADVSMTEEVERLGGLYRDADGAPGDLFEILAGAGLDTVRLRLWVDPYDEQGRPYLGGTNDLATTVRLARRARDAGLDLLLDLHYSDFWTDPKKQAMPKAWRGMSGSRLTDQVHTYTVSVLDTLAAADVAPSMVQVGNEITNGLLWPEGRVVRFDDATRSFGPADPAADDRLAALLGAGTSAVRASTDARVALHLDFGGAGALYRGWFDRMTARDVDLDVIALSYYPFWHGSLAELADNLADISHRYGKDVLVAETAYAFTAEAPRGHHPIFSAELAEAGGYPPDVRGQSAFLADLAQVVADVPQDRGLGLVYWEPAWLPVAGTSWASPAGMAYGDDVAVGGNPWANLGLFDFSGTALESLRVLGGSSGRPS
ncbi:glycoside hydrolase family 53 protein [Isoptericola aurantiacus]|uniref:glycoside hydrolase family 53 protein n=1 Tax=Isoptericola aurantiacus TaxID=3377839 RepID=UPI003839DD86